MIQYRKSAKKEMAMHISPLQTSSNASSPKGKLEDIPPVFCWTKMGTEAGQSLDGILRRKELERRAGHGLFAWGIGNSLGVAAKLAQEETQDSEVEVLFTPMRSAAKQVDVAPSQVLLWLGYLGENGEQIRLPNHMVITSRGNLEQGAESAHITHLFVTDNTTLLFQKIWELLTLIELETLPA